MGRNTKKLAILAMLIGIVGVLSVVGWSGRSPQPAPAPPTLAAPITPERDEVVLVTPRAQTPPVASRISVTFADDPSSPYALLKGASSTEKPSRRADFHVWYGQYSEQDFRVLPASPVEKEPSRLCLKVSFTF